MADKIRIEHITNSLYQMEQWSRYLRLALLELDPKMLVSTGGASTGPGMMVKPPILASGCPPPRREHDPDCNCPECCEDDTKGKGKGKDKDKDKKKKKAKTK